MINVMERLSRVLTEHPITDKLTVQTTAIASGAGTVAVDTMVQAQPEMWFGFTIVDWAAIFSICLALIALGKEVFKGIRTFKNFLEKRKQKKLEEQQEKETPSNDL
jgi:hypothetical protein